MRNRAGVIIVDEGTVLLMHRYKNGEEYFTVPGGGIEAGETSEQAAVREIEEETSLTITLGECVLRYFNPENNQHSDYYLAKSFTGTPKLSGEESLKNTAENHYILEWVPFDQLPQLTIYPEVVKHTLMELTARQA